MKNWISFSFLLLTFILPPMALAQDENVIDIDVGDIDRVVDNGSWTLVPAGCLGENASNPNVCGFKEFIQLIANIITALLAIALFVSVLLFSIAGFMYATAAGDQKRIETAKRIFLGVAIGLAIAFGAYLLVQVIVDVLGVESEFNLFLQN